MGQCESYWNRSCYDEGKRCAETLFMDYHRQNGVNIKIIRIFNTYGPRMNPDDGRVVSNFIVQALRNLPITIYGTGDQTRSFCYISDLVQATSKILTLGNCLGSPINIGNPNPISIKELAEEIELRKEWKKVVHIESVYPWIYRRMGLLIGLSALAASSGMEAIERQLILPEANIRSSYKS